MPVPVPSLLARRAAALWAFLCLPAAAVAEGGTCGDGVAAPCAGPLSATPPSPALALPGFVDAAIARPRLDLFVMSLCPYGMQAEVALAPLLARWGDGVDFHLFFIADEIRKGDGGDSGAVDAPAALPQASRRPACAGPAAPGRGPFSSLHGQPEVDEDRRQLVIAADHAEALLPYLVCRARAGPAAAWRPCARAVGTDPDSLDRAARGPAGRELLSDNLRVADRLDIDLSPTLLVDGVEYTGRLDPFAVGRALCARHPGAAPCADWPVCGRDEDCRGPDGSVSLCLDGDTAAARCQHQPAVAFDLHVLEADPQRCPACAADDFLAITRDLFPGARVQRHPGPGQVARSLAQRYGAQQLPAYILSREFARTARFERVRHLLLERGDAFVVRPRVAGTTYWPLRPHRPGRLDVYLPAAALGTPGAAARTPALEEQILQLWPGRGREAAAPASRGADRPDLSFHYLPAAGSAAAAPGDAADSLSLRRDEFSALLENRILVRGIQPQELYELWSTRPTP